MIKYEPRRGPALPSVASSVLSRGTRARYARTLRYVSTAEKAVAVDSISAYAATFWKLKYESSGLSAICVRSDDIPRYA